MFTTLSVRADITHVTVYGLRCVHMLLSIYAVHCVCVICVYVILTKPSVAAQSKSDVLLL